MSEAIEAFSPIFALPFELLAKIFVLGVGSHSDSELDSYRLQDTYRVLHVCSHWRNVAIQTRQLWTGPLTVSVSLGRRSEAKERAYAEALQGLLARSEPLPISICLRNFRSSSSFVEPNVHIMRALAETSSRWRSLRIRETVPESFIKTLAESGPFSCLEELDLRRVSRHAQLVKLAFALSFSSALRLRKLTIDLECRVPMPWALLSEVHIFATSQHYGNILGVLAQCANLLKASIVLSALSEPPPFRPTDTSLNHLESLSLTFVGESEKFFMPFLVRLSAPALESLSLACETLEDAIWDNLSFTNFQTRSPNITNLDISGNSSPIPSSSLISALTHSPLLTHLRVNDCSINDTFLRALTLREEAGSPPLVPWLYSLSLTGLADVGICISEDVLKRMIESRWGYSDSDALMSDARSGRCLQKVVLGGESAIHGSFRFSEDFMNAMKNLQGSTGPPSSIEFVEEILLR
ncbi:hypothetical protein R3P38DRAFT_2605743 [Favolaschia claudopus]|uniref:F-box domain-containing protein n=1 Tax=Favolaschia claudopus TaxID=2862362 RepID=A0AAW0D8X3_9AGAR